MKKSYAFLISCFSICLFITVVSCAGSPAQGNGSTAGAPSWVRDPYTKFDRQTHVAAVGFGSTREAAEKNALGSLVAFFGQSIQVDQTVLSSFHSAVANGAAAGWSESTAVDEVITTSAGMDSLIGAEIGDVWNDGKGTFYAAAILNRTRAIQTYSNLISSNQSVINNLVNMTAAEKNTLEGFSRYQFAATVADVTYSYANLLSQIGAPAFAQGLKRGDEYRLEAQRIASAIPIAITVTNDKAGRIQSAFAKVFSELGFRAGAVPAGTASRYTLNVNITLMPVELPNNPNTFVRMELDANLGDNGVTILPWNFSNREGHLSMPEAENRAFLSAERKIDAEYKDYLSEYLLRLLPK